MDSGSLFNKLWVIESLPAGDPKTGTHLVDNQLKDAKLAQPDLEVAFEQPDSKKSLIKVLEAIRDEARDSNKYPMIHFECHGCEDGLGTANGELVAWDDLREILIEINQACRLNLVVVLAACNGAHLIKVATKLDIAPFWAVIGPEVEVMADAVQRDFGAFYSKFFETLDGDIAIYELNQGVTDSSRQYHFLSAAGLFIRAYTKYYNTYCTGKGRRKRVENLVTQALENVAVKKRGVNWARKAVKNGLRNEEQHFNKMRTRFFLIDQFPENEVRFPLLYQEVLDKCKP